MGWLILRILACGVCFLCSILFLVCGVCVLCSKTVVSNFDGLHVVFCGCVFSVGAESCELCCVSVAACCAR